MPHFYYYEQWKWKQRQWLGKLGCMDCTSVVYQPFKLDFWLELLGILMNRDHLSNLIFGATFINLAIVGICTLTTIDTFLTMARLGVILCNCIMGTILLFNNGSKSSSSPLHRPYWLGMIICNIAIVKMVGTTYSINSISSYIFTVGLITVMLSLFSLGRSFSVTPMLSEIKTGFIYSLVRHPMYLGESIMLLSCVIAGNKFVLSSIIFVIYSFIMVLRIKEEEKLLSQTSRYKKYNAQTRWRLLPYIW